MAIIKAPYNFVPLEEIAFYPEWANHISQDIPFEDGVSGRIEYTITAKTPIYVRNGQKQEDKPENRDNTFSHTSDGKYFIPGTSIKGEIRSVLEILSFGKMTQVQDSRFGIRDLGKGSEGDRYKKLIQNVSCGWLSKNGDCYIMEDCGGPGRISPVEIDKKWDSSLENFDRTLKLGSSKNKEDDELLRSSITKYDLLGVITKDNERLSLDIDRLRGKFEFSHNKSGQNYYNYGQGEEGVLVLTGQPNNTKFYEFVFFEPKRTLDVDKDVIEDFLTIHKNNYDYLHLWKDRLYFGDKIPVFFLKEGNAITAIGLAYMFRYPTANFIKGAIPASLQSTCRKDLAECMFGTASEGLGALKGRVFFSPALAEGRPQQMSQVNTTLSSPKASFGPLYVKGGTWDDSNARIKGRKRYPVRDSVWNNEQGNDNTECSFIPLNEGTVFIGTVRFHNLKMEEYGALLSAMTFNGHSECYHSIGEAKPLGYGKVKIDLVNFNVANIVSQTAVENEAALKSFKDMMVKFYPAWEECASLKELFAMAKGIPSGREADFQYLKMSTTPRDNEFKIVKDDGKNLAYFTSVLSGQELFTNPSPARKIKRGNKLSAEIKGLDNAYYLKKNGLQTIENHLVKGELLEAGDLINKLDSAMPEKADLERRLSEQIQAETKHAEELYNNFMSSYRELESDAVIAEADRIINLYSYLMQLNTSEIKFVQRKQEVEEIKSSVVTIGTLGNLTLTQYFGDTALNSIAAFAGKLKKWMDAQGVTEISVSQAIELGQIVKDKSESLKSSDKKTWKDRKKWIPVLKIIGEEKTDLAFNAAFN